MERYLIESYEDPHCMFCRKSWNTAYMLDTFNKTFINGKLKQHRQNVLLERQKSMLPATQPDLKNELIRRENEKLYKETQEKYFRLRDELNQTQRLLNDIKNNMHRQGHVCQKEESTDNVVKCPVDNCRGYASNWTCGVCETNICSKCREPKLENHECNPDTVETVKFLKKESKPCPGCSLMISRVSGCDQMWCTQCHVTFSWRTGTKTHGQVHNPHYLDFLRQHRHLERDPRDVACGGVPSYHEVLIALRTAYKKERITRQENLSLEGELTRTVRNLLHIQHVTLLRYPTQTTNTHEYETKQRVLYLLNEIDEDQWKQRIQKNEKKLQLKREYGEIISMVLHTGSDIIRSCIGIIKTNHDDTHVKLHSSINDLEQLRTFANTNLIRVGTAYNCQAPTFNKCLEMR